MSMLAVRAGAGHVYACEKNPIVAEIARQTININGYSDRITIITKDSSKLEIGIDFPKPLDVLLWDNLANNLFQQGAVPAVEDARSRLIKQDAPVIPARCELRVALFEDLMPFDTTMGIIDGFDMSPFNTFKPAVFIMDADSTKRISKIKTIFDVNFRENKKICAEKSSVALCADGGRVDGIGQWLRFSLTDDIIYDTGEDDGVRAFGTLFYAVDSFDVAPRQLVEVGGAHDRMRTWFWIAPNPAITSSPARSPPAALPAHPATQRASLVPLTTSR